MVAKNLRYSLYIVDIHLISKYLKYIRHIQFQFNLKLIYVIIIYINIYIYIYFNISDNSFL